MQCFESQIQWFKTSVWCFLCFPCFPCSLYSPFSPNLLHVLQSRIRGFHKPRVQIQVWNLYNLYTYNTKKKIASAMARRRLSGGITLWVGESAFRWEPRWLESSAQETEKISWILRLVSQSFMKTFFLNFSLVSVFNPNTRQLEFFFKFNFTRISTRS